MKYRILQQELKSLRQQGLVDKNLKLNSSREELGKVYNRYQAKVERNQVVTSPVLVIWLILLCLGTALALVGLAIVATVAVLKTGVALCKLFTSKLPDFKVLGIKPKFRYRII